MHRFILSAMLAAVPLAVVASPVSSIVPAWATSYVHGHNDDTIVARYRNGNQFAYVEFNPLGENDWNARYTLAFSQDTLGVHEFSGAYAGDKYNPATGDQWHVGTQTRYTANCTVRLTLLASGAKFVLSNPVCHAITPALAQAARASDAESYGDGSKSVGADGTAIANGTVSNPARLQKAMGTWQYDGHIRVYRDAPDNRSYRFVQ